MNLSKFLCETAVIGGMSQFAVGWRLLVRSLSNLFFAIRQMRFLVLNDTSTRRTSLRSLLELAEARLPRYVRRQTVFSVIPVLLVRLSLRRGPGLRLVLVHA